MISHLGQPVGLAPALLTPCTGHRTSKLASTVTFVVTELEMKALLVRFRD
jgi:hypothetical protein